MACRYKDNCKFLKNQSCEYLHKNKIQSDNTDNDVVAEDKDIVEKVKMLEHEIIYNKKKKEQMWVKLNN